MDHSNVVQGSLRKLKNSSTPDDCAKHEKTDVRQMRCLLTPKFTGLSVSNGDAVVNQFISVGRTRCVSGCDMFRPG